MVIVRRKRDHRSDALITDGAPGHEAVVEEHVTGRHDFALSGDPDSIAAGHVGVKTEVDSGDAVGVDLCLRVGVPR